MVAWHKAAADKRCVPTLRIRVVAAAQNRITMVRYFLVDVHTSDNQAEVVFFLYGCTTGVAARKDNTTAPTHDMFTSEANF